jgi:excisionase family DNA binding protein
MKGETMAAPTEIHRPRDAESTEIKELYRLFLLEKAPALVGPDRVSIPIPESIFKILVQVVGYMNQGKGVSIIPVMQELTTQQAANILGVSRPFLIGLLNAKEIPCHKVGTHRRIYLKDVMDYSERRDKMRQRILAEIAKKDVEDGTYDQVYAPDQSE